MWKKRISLVLVLVFTLAIMSFATGCGGQETAAPPAKEPAATQPAEPAAPEVNEEEVITDAVSNFLTNQEKTAMVKADAVKDNLASFYIVDIRDAESFAKGHLEGAVNMSKAEVAQNLDKLPKDKPILVVCVSGQNASHTAGALLIAGLDAKSLIGGMGGWEKAALPVVK